MKVVRPGRPQKLPKPAPSVEDAPYMLVKKYAEPVYCKSHKDAVARIVKDIKSVQDTWKEMLIQDGVKACDEALKLVGGLSVDGGKVDAVVDPESGIRYRIELVRRQAA